MMASTFSSSINCLANDTAFSGLPALSLSTNSSFRPFTPPAALTWSMIIRAVLDSGAPRKAAGPVTEKIAPILIGLELSAARPRAVKNGVASQQAAMKSPSFLIRVRVSAAVVGFRSAPATRDGRATERPEIARSAR